MSSKHPAKRVLLSVVLAVAAVSQASPAAASRSASATPTDEPDREAILAAAENTGIPTGFEQLAACVDGEVFTIVIQSAATGKLVSTEVNWTGSWDGALRARATVPDDWEVYFLPSHGPRRAPCQATTSILWRRRGADRGHPYRRACPRRRRR